MMLPAHLQALCSGCDRVQLVIDNARRPTSSLTEEYYRRQSLCFSPVSEPRQRVQITSTPVPRRRNGAPVSASQQPTSRWESGSTPKLSETASPISIKASLLRPRVPIRRWSVEKDVGCSLPSIPRRRGSGKDKSRNSPMYPQRRSSDALSTSELINQVIDELKLYDSDDDSEGSDEDMVYINDSSRHSAPASLQTL